MRKRQFQAATRYIAEFELAGGEFRVEGRRIDIFAEQPDSADFHCALAKVTRRRKLLSQYLHETRSPGPALQELWQEDRALRAEWPSLETLEEWADSSVFSLLESLHKGETK